MKKILMAVVVSLFAGEGFAAVTPAYLALKPVKQFLDEQVESEIHRVLPPNMAVHTVVATQSNFMRGKFSEEEGGFAQFFGSTETTVTFPNRPDAYQVSCHLSGTAQVVPFAMSEHPVLEEEVNNEMLVLKKHQVSCRLQ